MRIKLLLLGAIVAILLSACGITNEVHFNKDYSGEYKVTMDMGDLIEMMSGLDPSMSEDGEMDVEEMFGGLDKSEFTDALKGMEGISNPNLEITEEYAIVMSFDFNDIDALNNLFVEWSKRAGEETAMEGMEMPGLASFGESSFVVDGKTVTHITKTPVSPSEMEVEGMEGMDMSSMMEGYSGMIDYQVILTFDKKIKEVGGEGIDILSQEKKSVTARVDMEKFMKSGAYQIAVITK